VTKPPPRKSLFQRAFANQYNAILLGGAGLFALVTFSWLPLLIGAGIETLWLVLGADTPFFKKWVEAQENNEAKEALAAQAAQSLKTLKPAYVERFKALEQIAQDINRMAEDNPSLETSLISDEMNKLGRLLNTFLQMATMHQRLSIYMNQNNETEIQRDINRCEQALGAERDREVKASLQQSLALAQKRMRQHADIESAFKVVSVKMDTLEKSFRYLRSHILAIGKREELTEEIDGLIDGVESVEALNAETDPLIEELGRARIARAVGTGTKR
jgi:hypothetical protein